MRDSMMHSEVRCNEYKIWTELQSPTTARHIRKSTPTLNILMAFGIFGIFIFLLAFHAKRGEIFIRMETMRLINTLLGGVGFEEPIPWQNNFRVQI